MDSKSSQNIALKVKLNTEPNESLKAAGIKPAQSHAKLGNQERKFKNVQQAANRPSTDHNKTRKRQHSVPDNGPGVSEAVIN